MRLPAESWKDVAWREGSNQTLSSRFAAVRVRPASRDHKLVAPHPVEWLVVEWPEGEAEPTKYWLSTLPEGMPLAALVDVIKLRWAHRTRLRGIEERTRPCSFRGARLAGIPSSRQPLHRSLRIPDPREIGFSPLSALAPRKTSPFRPFSVLTHPRFVPNATGPTRSPRCAGN